MIMNFEYNGERKRGQAMPRGSVVTRSLTPQRSHTILFVRMNVNTVSGKT